MLLLSTRRSSSTSKEVLLLALLLILVVWSMRLLVFMHWTLGRLMLTIFKSKHLWRLFITVHMIMMLKLMRHLCVHLRGIFIRMLNMMILSFMILAITKSLGSSVCPLYSFWSLRSMSRMSEWLSFFDTLINHHITSRLLLILVEVLLLLIKSWSWSSSKRPIFLIVYVFWGYHLGTCLSLSRIWGIKCFIFIIKWMQWVKYSRVSVSFYSNIIVNMKFIEFFFIPSTTNNFEHPPPREVIAFPRKGLYT